MWLPVKFCWFAILVCLAKNRFTLGQNFNGEKIAIGAIFDQNTEEIQNVFKYAMTQHNQNVSSRGRFELQAYVDVINTADAFKLSRLICNQFARGVWSMLGAVTPDSFDTLHSYTNTFQMPFVTPWFPEKVIPPSSGLIDHAVNMRPEYHKAIVDTILYYGWNEIIYVYDSYDGLLRLQQLYQLIQPGRTFFKISFVKLINNSTEAIDFLLDLERLNRWGSKRIVLDCSAATAKSIIVSHVQHTQLGRRTYHYLLSGLVMDDHWEKDVMEYGALNITGFRIIDHSRKIVRDFIEGFRKMDPRVKDSISAQAALMYDGVQALIDALGRLWRKKPDAFKNAIRRTTSQGNATKVIDCNPGKSWVIPFEHGDKISRLIKKSELEGLTGNISFNDDGHRHDFSLQIVEMTVQSVMVKVATWSDKHGLTSMKNKHAMIQTSQNIYLNKTYVITTLLHEPYMMLHSLDYGQLSNEKFYGFCKDLIEYISQETGINFFIKVVKDGAYGSEGSNKEWNGMVGEIKRKEADLAVGPLAITKEREKVVDFSEPFLSFNYAIKTRRNTKTLDTFSFLKPLSKEIWLCVLFSFFAVSIVLFLLSRFSPREWNFLSMGEPVSGYATTERNDVILHNEHSIWNSFWFSLGSFMQQGIDNVPKSFSGRIVGTVWWFFALILVCSYTANFAAYLIVECLNEPAKALHSLAAPELHYAFPGILMSYYIENGLIGIGKLKKQTNNIIFFLEWYCKVALLTCTTLFRYSFFQSVACTNIGEDPVLAGDDLKNTDYAIDENGINICSKGFYCQPKFVEFAIAFPKESQIREKINLVILNMKKSEKLCKLLRKWLLNKDQQDCMLEKKEENLVTELTLSQVAGIFYILIGGLIVALSVALLEFYHNSYSGTSKANSALKTTTTKIKLDNKRDVKIANRATSNDSHRLRWNGAPYQGVNT